MCLAQSVTCADQQWLSIAKSTFPSNPNPNLTPSCQNHPQNGKGTKIT